MKNMRNWFRARLAKWLLDGYYFTPAADRPLTIAYSRYIVLENCEHIHMVNCVVDKAENVFVMSDKPKGPEAK